MGFDSPGLGGGTRSGMRDAGFATVVGVAALFAGGIAYMVWCKENVLWKVEKAFAAGYGPAIELANQASKWRSQASTSIVEESDHDLDGPWTQHLRFPEQDLIDRIVQGDEVGHYFVLLGPKGTGKSTMILDAVQAVKAEGVAMCDAHPDIEVFRLRLGRALNYEFNEDSPTGLLRRRDSREGGSALQIERALNKLEKVAVRHTQQTGKPLVLVLANVHNFNRNDDGRNMLLQLQQRAEGWAASGILTMVFSSDDLWPFLVMRKNASRMHVVSVPDLSPEDALTAGWTIRMDAGHKEATLEELKEVVRLVGARNLLLTEVCSATDMVKHARHLLATEKTWLLSQIGLTSGCDDDVVEEQKFSSCSWLLLREFVRRRKEDVERLKGAIERGEATQGDLNNLPMPRISYYECRQIMSRADFMDDLDRKNIITINMDHDVSPDNMLILHAAEEVVTTEGFDELLKGVRDRIDEIESLRCTRKLTDT